MPKVLPDVHRFTDASSPRRSIDVAAVSESTEWRYWPKLANAYTVASVLSAPWTFDTDVSWVNASASAQIVSLDALRVIPHASVDIIPEPSFSDRLRLLIDALRPVLYQLAVRRGVSVAAVNQSQFIDPEEATQETVLTMKVRLSPDAALNYWDEVGATVETWVATLSPADADLVQRHLAVFVEPA